MQYQCTNCFYVYDENLWEPDADIEANTSFLDLPDSFYCPNCFSSKEDFISPKEEIIYLDKDSSTIVEAIHYPKMNIVWDELEFEIWEEPHPVTPEHFIKKVALFDNVGDILEEKKFNSKTKPAWKFDLSYLDEFEIRVYCNHDWVFSTGILERNSL